MLTGIVPLTVWPVLHDPTPSIFISMATIESPENSVGVPVLDIKYGVRVHTPPFNGVSDIFPALLNNTIYDTFVKLNCFWLLAKISWYVLWYKCLIHNNKIKLN